MSGNYIEMLPASAAGWCWRVLAGAGSVIVMIFIYQISDIKPLLQENVGANEPLELASGELQLETTRVTEKCV